MPQVNPKDLSNEELEYVIRTGRLTVKYQQPVDDNSFRTSENVNYSKPLQESKSVATAIAAL
jgi:hypothetical protein